MKPEQLRRIKRREHLIRRRRIIIGFFLLLIAILIVFIIFLLKGNLNRNSSSSTSAESHISESSQTSVPSNTSQETSTEPTPNAEMDEWYLTLVNTENPLPEDFRIDLAFIEEEYARDEGFDFDARAVEHLNEMCKAAKEDGIDLLVISPYRSISKQTQLYNNKIDYYKQEGYDGSEAAVQAATIVAPPGTSEHNLGLAVDLNSLEESFENSSQFAWLQEHAEEYGFIMRYPKDKQDITGISYEPWHYRYVSVKHAKRINELGMCLEEYIEHLKEGNE